MASQAPVGDAHLYSTPTQGAYALSDAVVAVICGPMGEGKSLASVHAIFVHLDRCRDTLLKMDVALKVAIIRDTHENIKRSIVTVFDEFFGGMPGIKHNWRNDWKHLTIETKPKIECDLFGIDDLSGVSKLQGSAYSLIWLDDPVPYTDSTRANAGISEDVYNAALVRCARQAGMRDGLSARLQISTNLPDDDHWFNARVLEPPDGPVDPRTPLIKKEVFHIPYGENVFLSDLSRQATIAAYAHDDVAYQRFVLGKIATRFPGRQVAKNFNDKWHISPVELEPEKGWDSWITFDSWGNPAAVLGQVSPLGQVRVLDICKDAQDIRALIEGQVMPLLGSPRWKDKARTMRYMGDATMLQPDQSNVEESAARVVEEYLKEDGGPTIFFEPGPSTWEHIRMGLFRGLGKTINGEIGVLICPYNCRALIAGLRGRWHYPVNKSGVRTNNKPVKSESSHVCDAFANALCVLASWHPPGKWQKKRESVRKRKMLNRAKSYSAG
jgi:hypothetical protein